MFKLAGVREEHPDRTGDDGFVSLPRYRPLMPTIRSTRSSRPPRFRYL